MTLDDDFVGSSEAPDISGITDEDVGADVLLKESKKIMLSALRTGKTPSKEYISLLKTASGTALAEKRLKADEEKAASDQALAVALANRLLDDNNKKSKTPIEGTVVPVRERLAAFKLPDDIEFDPGELSTELEEHSFNPDSVKKDVE